MFRLLVQFAFRNLFRHKGKSLVVGSILCFGAFIMTFGNGVISGLNEGLTQHLIQQFCGHIVVVSDKQETDNILINPMARPIEPIRQYKIVEEALKNNANIQGFVPALQGYAMILDDVAPDPDYVMVVGVDINRYQSVFNTPLKVLEGRLNHSGEAGLLVTPKNRERIYDFLNIWTIPQGGTVVEAHLTEDAKKRKTELRTKDSLVLIGSNEKQSTLDVVAPILGVVKFKALNGILGLYNFVDVDTFRQTMGFIQAEQKPVSKKTQAILDIDETNLDALLSGGPIPDHVKKEVKTDVPAILKNDEVYTQVFVKLKPQITLKTELDKMNAQFKKQGIPARAISWKNALGEIAQTASLMKFALFLFVGFVFFVAIVIVMNTLSMAALERTAELGMMRAIGVQKWFVSALFFLETSLLALFFGGLGMGLGVFAIKVFAWLKLSTDNDFLQLFYGGDTFHPLLHASDVMICVVQLVFVTILSVLYPLWVARKITALDAVSRD